MVTLDQYLYEGDTILKILRRYRTDLKKSAVQEKNQIDLIHCKFLQLIEGLLEHNDFLTLQSQRMRDFYKYMAANYPFLAFTFRGRIKSLIRAEQKFNGHITRYIYDYYNKHGRYPTLEELKARLDCFRDLLAYRIVVSLPKCHLKPGENREEREIAYLYQIANKLPEFLEERGFIPELAEGTISDAVLLDDNVRPYYKDYIAHPKTYGYQSLHITFYDNMARCYIEVQLRTKAMDDYAEIGVANHSSYEARQQQERARRDAIPQGENKYFDDAYERGRLLERLDLAALDVNMFSAANNSLINDGCGLYRGRMILPYEHLSRFQNDLID